jgi:ureidoglycolate lyase
MMRLKLRPLDRDAFAPFGQVLDWRDGLHPRRNYAAELANDRLDAVPNLRVQRTEPTPLPHVATKIERHPHSSQVFAPLSGGPYFVIVFPSDAQGEPLVDQGIAFAARGDQAVNYNRGTWHHAFMAREQAGTFLMLRWEDGTPDDEEVRPLDAPIVIED